MPSGGETTYDLTTGVHADLVDAIHFYDPSPEELARRQAEAAREYDGRIEDIPLEHEVEVPECTMDGEEGQWKILHARFVVQTPWGVRVICRFRDPWRGMRDPLGEELYVLGQGVKARRPA